MLHRLAQKLKRILRNDQTASHNPAGSGIAPLLDSDCLSQVTQLVLMQQYRQLVASQTKLPLLMDVGFSRFSEADEDGILLFLFSVIGTKCKRLVDLGAGSITGSNTANLLLNHGWHGLLIDAESSNTESLRNFFGESRYMKNLPPQIVCQWITADNVNDILLDNGFEGEIDLLSIDIDGMDYWIWKALDIISPRVVVVEYQCIWGADVSVAVPYNPRFKATYSGRFGIHNSASLRAFEKLSQQKGYRLVGSQKYGYNAFFVRNDLPEFGIPSVRVEDCQNKPFVQWAQKEFGERIKDFEWIEV